jgi:hypothetical protein
MPRETESLYLEEEGVGGMVSFLAGVGLGAVVGAAFALALAPEAGEDTRRKLGALALRARAGLARLSRPLGCCCQPSDPET